MCIITNSFYFISYTKNTYFFKFLSLCEHILSTRVSLYMSVLLYMQILSLQLFLCTCTHHTVQHLGDSTAVLQDIVSGKHPFSKVSLYSCLYRQTFSKRPLYNTITVIKHVVFVRMASISVPFSDTNTFGQFNLTMCIFQDSKKMELLTMYIKCSSFPETLLS